ncbi:MAG TPA: VOC family protein [Mycobacterium sp.]|jgi:catechol 2,3-dioxygenase-like lactoylglutathione lyase family enzyme|uniref:VOC family protein n=1 Tax=Mycobacterium sp. TaxID=1785 RepID=UPI002BEBCBE1|nr:VOC family protein [Mycobacterium sp.]HXO81168.1 VOC family protein [Mycobacterium sp.]
MTGVHHTAIVTTDVERALSFWRDGLGLTVLFDHVFTGDWPTLFDATSDTLRSIFLGDLAAPDTGIVELVVFDDPAPEGESTAGPAAGFFLISLNREVEPTLRRLADLGFADDARQIAVPAPHGKQVQMAVVTAPDRVRVELIGPAR